MLLVLPDQLSTDLAPFADADPDRDVVVMAELEQRRGAQHKQRLALFFSAQRHFRDALEEDDFTVDYLPADAAGNLSGDGLPESYAAFLQQKIEEHQPDAVAFTEPGNYALREALCDAVEASGAALRMQADTSFLCSHEDFEAWADDRNSLTMEYFYREMRRRYDILMDGDDPEGGDWNYDEDNRESFGNDGPGLIKAPTQFQPDDVTEAVLAMVEDTFPDAYGALEHFDWPVTREEAQRAVRDFAEHRLPTFGTYQDAMWTGRPFLYHSRLAAAINQRLVDPRYVLDKVLDVYEQGDAPLNAVEGFVRQILGWREYVRGVYWLHAPGYEEKNALNARRELPDLYWTGQTDMTCMRESIGQLVEHAYGHHIQRLMVTGLFGLLYGIKPQAMNDWHMAMYVDAWPWVSAPNMVGMTLYADGGIVGSKPYTASGRYINRQSNYCRNCRYDPKESTGEDACPFTTLYWDFLIEHEDELDGNRRMNFQLANVRKKDKGERADIADRAKYIRRKVREGTV